jgi:hypothetical protein
MWMAYDICAATFLLTWLVCSCVAQWDVPWLFRLDFLGLFPNCKYFAPKPISLDLAVYVRSIDDKENFSPWRSLVPAQKGVLCAIWNPQHRLRKAIHDLLGMLQQHDAKEETRHLSLPYLLLLNATTAKLCAGNRVAGVQFVISGYAGYENAVQDIIFLSHLHTC